MALGSPAMLALLGLMPAAAIGWWWLWRARRLHRLAVQAQVAGARTGLTASRLLLLVALGLIAVAASRPMWNAGQQTLGQSDFSLIVALDVSQSMAAEDVGSGTAAPVSRFTAAASEVRRLIDGRRGDRVGLVIFAGTAFLRFPLTRDHEAALQVLEALQPGEALVVPGSDIASGIELAAATILRASEEDGLGRVNGAITVVSDGEVHVGDAEAAAAAARAQGLQVFAVGVGSERGSTIPIGASGEPKLNAENNAPIITRLDSGHLQRIAEAGGGRYLELDQPGAMAGMNADLAALDLVREVVIEDAALAEQFQWFAGAAALVLLGSLAARVFGWTLGGRFGLGMLSGLAATMLLTSGCGGPSVDQLNHEGVRQYEAEQYAEALDSWREAQEFDRYTDDGIDPRLHLNVGRALHQLGEFERAETETLSALRSDDPAVRAMAWFHTGNHRWASEDLLGARLAFIEALRESPSLLDAKINLEIVNGLLSSLLEDNIAQDDGDRPGAGGQDGQASDTDESEANLSDDGTAGDGQPNQAGREGQSQAASGGQGAGARPTTPTFGEEESLLEQREAATAELQAALDQLPLEDASLEQALAVLDALRAVPGERLSAGRFQFQGQPLDW